MWTVNASAMAGVTVVVMEAVETTVAEKRAVEMVREKDAEVVEAAVTVAQAAPTEATIQAMVAADLAAKVATVVKMASVVLVVAKAHIITEADLLPTEAMAPDRRVASDQETAREAILRTVATAVDKSAPEATADVTASRDPMV